MDTGAHMALACLAGLRSRAAAGGGESVWLNSWGPCCGSLHSRALLSGLVTIWGCGSMGECAARADSGGVSRGQCSGLLLVKV